MIAFRTLLVKDLRLLARQRGRVLAAAALAVLVILMTSLSGSAGPEALRERGVVAFWLALFLASLSLLGDAFDSETREGALRHLVLLGVDPAAFFYAKALTNALVLTGLAFLLVPFSVALLGIAGPADAADALKLSGVLVLGAFSLAAPGTFFSALVSESDRRHLLLPLILLPLAIPVLIAAARSTDLVLRGDPMNQLPAWVALQAVFAVLHWALDGLLYSRAAE